MNTKIRICIPQYDPVKCRRNISCFKRQWGKLVPPFHSLFSCWTSLNKVVLNSTALVHCTATTRFTGALHCHDEVHCTATTWCTALQRRGTLHFNVVVHCTATARCTALHRRSALNCNDDVHWCTALLRRGALVQCTATTRCTGALHCNDEAHCNATTWCTGALHCNDVAHWSFALQRRGTCIARGALLHCTTTTWRTGPPHCIVHMWCSRWSQSSQQSRYKEKILPVCNTGNESLICEYRAVFTMDAVPL